MIFSDIVEYYNELNTVINELDIFYNDALAIKSASNEILKETIKSAYIVNNSSYYSNIRNITTKHIKIVKESMLKQNLLKLGKLIRTIEHQNTYNMISTISSSLIGSLEYYAENIHNFNNSSSNDFTNNFINLLLSVNTFVTQINLIKGLIIELNRFEFILMNAPENITEDNIFSIRLYNENLSVKDINLLMKSISNIYERSCTLFNISINDYPLEPIKIESGSLLEKVFGHEKILRFMGDLFNRTISYIYRNFTNEGKLSTVGTKIDTLKEEIKLIDLCEEHGIDTSTAKEILHDNLNVLCNDILKVTTSSTKISVNGQTYDLAKSIDAKILENIPKNLTATTEHDRINNDSDI